LVQTLMTGPEPVRAPAGAARGRAAAWARSTPGRLTGLTVLVTALAVLAGLAAVIGTVRRAGLADAVRGRSGPLTVTAQQLYRSLSDADATAAAAFLASGVEPADLRSRYQADIAAASAALTTASGAADSDQAALRRIAGALPVYTALIDTARAYNRMNLPLGAAYLREASGLMRQTLLPAAAQLYRSRTARLADDRGGAAGLPWLALLLVLLTLGALVLTQAYLLRRTNRMVNLGLASATAAGLAVLLWLLISWAGSAGALHAGERDGSAQVQAVSQARVSALQARADEALTLVAHGNGASFEADYVKASGQLRDELQRAAGQAADPAVRGVLRDAVAKASQWHSVHVKLRAADDGGRYGDAVTLAIGTQDPAGAAALSAAVDADLAKAIAAASAEFDRDAARAGRALTATGLGFAALVLLLLAGAVAGIRQRIDEYR
jgi:hypothetical protein